MVSHVLLLLAAITKNRMIYCSFTSLCVNSLYLVEHVGVHALFVPEVISSDTLKKVRKRQQRCEIRIANMYRLDGQT